MKKYLLINVLFVLFLILSCSNEVVFNEKDNTVETVSDDSLINYLDEDYGTEKALREKFIKLAAFNVYKRSEKEATEEINNFISFFKNNGTVSKDSNSYVITKAESMNIPFDNTSSVISKDVITISDEENVCLNIYDTVNCKTGESCYVIIPNDRRFGDVIFMSDSGTWEDVKDLEITQFLIQDIIDTIKYKMEIWNSITEEEIEYEKNRLGVLKDITITSIHNACSSRINMGSNEILNTIKYNQGGIYNDVIEKVYGKDYLVGCGAIGVSIICTYFGWPEKFIEYTENGRMATLENVKKAFPEHADWDGTYDYDAIRNGRNDFQTAVLCFNIAEIMNSHYGLSSTYTYDSDINNALDKLVFNYNRDYMSEPIYNELMKKIISSIEDDKPIITSGAATGASSGHVYVTDGGKIVTKTYKILTFTIGSNMTSKVVSSTDSNEIYLHFNLGWGGRLNGWYDPYSVTSTEKFVCRCFFYNISK